MNLREVIKILRFERRRVLAMSRVCEPEFAGDYLRTARALGIAVEVLERVGGKHRRKGNNDENHQHC